MSHCARRLRADDPTRAALQNDPFTNAECRVAGGRARRRAVVPLVIGQCDHGTVRSRADPPELFDAGGVLHNDVTAVVVSTLILQVVLLALDIARPRTRDVLQFDGGGEAEVGPLKRQVKTDAFRWRFGTWLTRLRQSGVFVAQSFSPSGRE